MTTTTTTRGKTKMNADQQPQLTRADLANMSPDQIEAARVAGQLDELRGIPLERDELIRRATDHGPISRAELAELARYGRADLAAAYADRRFQITDTPNR